MEKPKNIQSSTSNIPTAMSLESRYFYFFRHYKLGAIYKTQAIHSDAALLKCLKETHWRMDQLVYEGKETINPYLLNLLSQEG